MRLVREPWVLAFAEPVSDWTDIETGSPSTAEAHARLRQRGGVDVRQTRLYLGLQGVAAETVVVRNIGVEVQRQPLLEGCRVSCPTAGGN